MAYDETDKFEIPVTKLQWGLRGAQIFFALIAVFTISAVIGWDNQFFSASLISVFFLFFILISIFFAAAIVVIPHLYVTRGKFKDAARALRIPRIEFVLSAIWAVLILIFTFSLTLDAYVLRKCDPSDPKYSNFTSGSSNQSFYDGLPHICRTQRAANAFGWFTLTAWLCSLLLIANDWRKNRRPPKPQEPILYHTPSNSSLPPSLEGQTPAQHQENVPMQTTSHSPLQQQYPQQYTQQQQFSTTFPQQSSMPEPQIPGQGQGQGQNPIISFPEPKPYQ